MGKKMMIIKIYVSKNHFFLYLKSAFLKLSGTID